MKSPSKKRKRRLAVVTGILNERTPDLYVDEAGFHYLIFRVNHWKTDQEHKIFHPVQILDDGSIRLPHSYVSGKDEDFFEEHEPHIFLEDEIRIVADELEEMNNG